MDYPLIVIWKYILAQEHRLNFLDISCTFLCTEELSILRRIFHSTALFWHFNIIIYIMKTRAASKPMHFGGIRKADSANSWRIVGFGNNLSVPFEFVHTAQQSFCLNFCYLCAVHLECQCFKVPFLRMIVWRIRLACIAVVHSLVYSWSYIKNPHLSTLKMQYAYHKLYRQLIMQ